MSKEINWTNPPHLLRRRERFRRRRGSRGGYGGGGGATYEFDYMVTPEIMNPDQIEAFMVSEIAVLIGGANRDYGSVSGTMPLRVMMSGVLVLGGGFTFAVEATSVDVAYVLDEFTLGGITYTFVNAPRPLVLNDGFPPLSRGISVPTGVGPNQSVPDGGEAMQQILDLPPGGDIRLQYTLTEVPF